jgi:lysine-specific demethylase/histidyl-hydroxylase NO66
MKRKTRDTAHREGAEAAGELDEPLMLPPVVVTDDGQGSTPPVVAAVSDALRLDVPALALAVLVTPAPLSLLMRCWGTRPVLVTRAAQRPGHCSGLLSSEDVKALLSGGQLRYGLNVDLAIYDPSRGRQTLNAGQEVASLTDVMRHFNVGKCSVRVLHPQRYFDPLLQLVTSLERHFSTPVGCNAYWTPQGSQGFAPHYDDIDALVVQLEGRKRWRLYAPRSTDELLPRVSSPNFSARDCGAPLAEVVLEPGDVLYMPRGLVHEAFSLPSDAGHSLHITLSMGQRTAWIDLLELAIPAALRAAAEEMPELRANLPRRFLDVMGAMHSDEGDTPGSLRGDIIAWARALMHRVCDAAPLDAAADQLGAAFQRTRAPPHVGAAAAASVELAITDRVRLAFAGCARMVIEDGSVVVYHPFGNTRDHLMAGDAGGDDEPEGALVFPVDVAHVVEALLRMGPSLCCLADLAAELELDTRELVDTAEELARAGVLIVPPADT